MENRENPFQNWSKILGWCFFWIRWWFNETNLEKVLTLYLGRCMLFDGLYFSTGWKRSTICYDPASLYLNFVEFQCREIPWRLRSDANIHTLQETNISPKNGILKMIFLFPRWDMLIPWRVFHFIITWINPPFVSNSHLFYLHDITFFQNLANPNPYLHPNGLHWVFQGGKKRSKFSPAAQVDQRKLSGTVSLSGWGESPLTTELMVVTYQGLCVDVDWDISL